MYKLSILSFLLYAVSFFFGCSVPQYIWPQNDVEFYEINQKTLKKKILIASRKSEYKIKIVEKIQTAFRNRDIYIKTIGIETLKQEDANQYSAVLIINTSMGWEIDRKVESFLNKYGDLNSIIVLTTSAGGDILPDMDGRQVDAISSASVKENINQTADKIISKIENLLKKTLDT